MGTETEAATQDTFQAMKRSMLVGMNPKTEEVCQVSILKEHTPQIGHILNRSLVQILQNRETRFVSCTDKMRPSCHGIDEKYTSECVPVFKSAPAMVRLFNSRGPYTMEIIRVTTLQKSVSKITKYLQVPIFCECRLRRQYRDFERPEK
ncbi:Protein CBG16165 [Caenorhabditis briggsae]|uniref:Protein CBG16165 n=1 Tax=Caenorhabditis briggsae TaxID=6238 RepID=A8XNZ3_CAEBR|nr:Protein CBG16165 [Caenorhabditis briggsae]CAP34233.2 Protein CBG16165 [Caenorhabditis briggsae]